MDGAHKRQNQGGVADQRSDRTFSMRRRQCSQRDGTGKEGDEA
jgi:hypothetical protein